MDHKKVSILGLVLICLLSAFVISVTAEPPAITWVKYPGNPVLWKTVENHVLTSSVIFDEDDGLYKVWYSKYEVGNLQNIWYATSPDLVHWTKHGAVNLFSHGEPFSDPANWPYGPDGISGTSDDYHWDGVYMFYPCVIIPPEPLNQGYKFWMYYTARSSQGKRDNNIGLAFSNDGINWIKYDDPTTTEAPFHESDPVLAVGPEWNVDWDGNLVQSCSVIYAHGSFHMWFVGEKVWNFPNTAFAIGYATSTDGIHWTKYDDPTTTADPYANSDPVLLGVSGTWETPDITLDGHVECPRVIKYGAYFRMLYQGYEGDLGEAWSTDGIHWTKNPANPVIVKDQAWESFVGCPSNILENKTHYILLYNGDYDNIGLASAEKPIPVGGIWVPINKFELLAPYIGLVSVITTVAVSVSVVYVKRRKKQQN